jgi:hypothetical protein
VRHFLGDAATPPRGDARRGLRFFQNDTSKPPIVVSALLDAPLNDFRKANLDICASKEGEVPDFNSFTRSKAGAYRSGLR